MAHQIKDSDLHKWQETEKVLFASSSKEQKRLYVTLRGTYEVYHKGIKIKETILAYSAINEYNQITK